jgi:hypothetical protein
VTEAIQGWVEAADEQRQTRSFQRQHLRVTKRLGDHWETGKEIGQHGEIGKWENLEIGKLENLGIERGEI